MGEVEEEKDKMKKLDKKINDKLDEVLDLLKKKPVKKSLWVE